MRKQTKLVAVLSASALLAIGASMTSFAASPWVEENGTWVYYEKNGEKVTEGWRKSGSQWYWLDENGEMAENQLVEYENDHYYVDQGGAMVLNGWRSVPNDDYDGDDNSEPMEWWYYFGSNGKAYKASNSSTRASFKTIGQYKYIFDTEGRMSYGWIDPEGNRLTDDTGWQEGEYYCGDWNDGRQRNNEWAYLEIIDSAYTDASPNQSTQFTFDDETQTRWFWFLANGKKVRNKEQTIGKAKYSFDKYGRMNAEWATEKGTETPNEAKQSKTNGDYTTTFRYYGSPEDGAKVSRGFFKAVPDYYLDTGDYDSSTERTYYADGKGNLLASVLKSIPGSSKKYAFNSFGEMQTGLKALWLDGSSIKNIHDSEDYYDTEENFLEWYTTGNGYKMYYFGSDGAMLTGKQTISLDGENYTFFFNKSGAQKGRGFDGEKDGRYYFGGMMLKAEKGEKFGVIVADANTGKCKVEMGDDFYRSLTDSEKTPQPATDYDNEKYAAAYDIVEPDGIDYILVNPSGAIQTKKSKAKDSNGYCFDTNASGKITAIYIEN